MKIKIVFMVINMNIGGTEKALLNMIEEMPRDQYEITILMLEKYGGFLESIPSRVNAEYLDEYFEMKDELNKPPKTVALNLIKKGQFVKGVGFTLTILLSKVIKNKGLLFKFLLRNVHELEKKYDVAVAYAGPMDFISYFVIKKIKADKKIQWIHFDITKIGFDVKFAEIFYKKFDKIFVVSKEGKKKINQKLPKLKERIETFSNILSTDKVLRMADEGLGFTDDFNGIRILTVGRLSIEKGQDLIIPILARLREKGLNIRWYCIGEGNARSEYETLISDHQVKEDFILLGANSNPYPYMKECDIYVQPSRHEGFCITLGEAKCFNKPIVSTNFTGAKEQISNNKTGLIVGFDKDQMVNAIEQMINKDFREQIVTNIQKEHTSNTSDFKQFF
ncbi:glycosyltransferase [Aquibacillus saliphilus]|uniref:glycosyltransferase n=1 Tax=Aquibacillus saliphilus TaxID=1909422 RepID=UPI001CF0622C|nr:glycosyltransferase [Aquibacillus saliphilus]